MAIIFAAIPQASGFKAYRANSDNDAATIGDVTNVAKAGALWNRVYRLGDPAVPGSLGNLTYQGGRNLPQTRNRGYGMRVRFGFTGTAGGGIGLWNIMGSQMYPGTCAANLTLGGDGKFLFSAFGMGNGGHESIALGQKTDFVNDRPYDLVFNWNGQPGTNNARLYIDGVYIGNAGDVYRGWDDPWQTMWQNNITLGTGQVFVNGAGMLVEEFWIEDGPIDFTLYTGLSRTAPLAVAPLNGLTWPLENTVDSTAPPYYSFGVTKTPSFVVPPASTNPGAGNVREGVDFIFQGDLVSGLLRLPPEEVVVNGIEFGNVPEFTGTLLLPGAVFPVGVTIIRNEAFTVINTKDTSNDNFTIIRKENFIVIKKEEL